ncbi:MAG TPA: archease [Verrucomicrobiae bacterium]|nr:archease [Verrucomicrobiae bacterium]
MPYRYIEEIATADVAFEAWGEALGEVFSAAVDATTNVMVQSLESVRREVTRPVELSHPELDLLLFDLLNEVVYLKDAEQLLMLADDLQVEESTEGFSVKGTLTGERLDMERHPLVVDVKAVTLHMFSLRRTEKGWSARVILDI